LVSSADKAFRYDDSYKTAIGLRNLLTFQQRVAYSTGSAFYNTYASMGGEGSMVRWVNSNPPLAFKDYTHLTPKGADIIGKSIYDAILFEYNKAVQNSSN
jgi:lysophospholipase L1-like esterase